MYVPSMIEHSSGIILNSKISFTIFNDLSILFALFTVFLVGFNLIIFSWLDYQ